MSGDTIPDSDFPVDPGDTSADAQAAAVAGAEPPAPEATPAEAAPAAGAGADGPAQAGSEDRVSELESRLASLQAEHEALRGQYMRMAADFDNFRKRQSRDHDDLSEEALGLHRSYQGLYRQLVDVFKQLGVSPMRVEGEPFDPSLHEAVLRAESEEHPEDVVIEELQRGYHLNGRVLRHALVKVSMGPGPAAGQAPAAPEEQAG
jgi:molecular chaperone GrpE